MADRLFGQKLKVINLGLSSFSKSLSGLGVDVVQMDFKPPAGGDTVLMEALSRTDNPRVAAANRKAFEKITGAQPVLVDVRKAGDVIPGMGKGLILHAGPPIGWDRMCGPVRGAIIGALMYEGLASDEKSAEALASSGRIKYEPCHHHGAVGRWRAWSLRRCTCSLSGTRPTATPPIALSRGARQGVEVRRKLGRCHTALKWMENVLAPHSPRRSVCPRNKHKGAYRSGAHDGRRMSQQKRRGYKLFLKEIIPHLLNTDLDKKTISEVVAFISGNPHFYLNLSMPRARRPATPYRGSRTRPSSRRWRATAPISA